MAIETICSADANEIIQGIVYPLTAVSAIVTTMVIGMSYMAGNALSNPRITLWAKTEFFQLIISMVAVGIMLGGISTFCVLDVGSIYELLDVGASGVPAGLTVFDAANSYLTESGIWVHDLLHVARYHMGAYNILQAFGRNECEDVGPSWLFCLFGPILPSPAGGAGAVSITNAPNSGYGLLSSALGAAFNSLMLSYLSILNYLFILRFVFSGFVLFFLPLGIFLRALPYLRTLGSLLMSVAISFLIVYPFILAAFYIDFKAARILAPTGSAAFNYADEDIGDKVDLSNVFDGDLSDDVFDDGGDQTLEVIKLSGNAFIVGVFIPSLALLGAAAAVGYINRFLGEEIDLSRIVQLM
ncbi:MAG: hypothetical protein AB1529_04370 [Candidatus Micrarchaeota archaeon]